MKRVSCVKALEQSEVQDFIDTVEELYSHYNLSKNRNWNLFADVQTGQVHVIY